jgi:hypothetical protein
MRDFHRDWRRWSRIERIGFVFLAIARAIGVPAALGVSGHRATPSIGAAGRLP